MPLLLRRHSFYALSLTSLLAACGGGGDSEQAPVTEKTPDLILPVEPPITKSQGDLRILPAATLATEEAAVLMAPGSLHGLSIGIIQAPVDELGPAGATSLSLEIIDCTHGKHSQIGETRLIDAKSPFSGELFNHTMTSTAYCVRDVYVAGELQASLFTQGTRRVAYPQSGNVGSTFIAYEETGASLEQPYIAAVVKDGVPAFGWARLWKGHVLLEYGTEGGSSAVSGEAYLYQVSQEGSTQRSGQSRLELQFGLEDQPFHLAFSAPEGEMAEKGWTEVYEGSFGVVRDLSDSGLPGACPGGLLDVQTTGLAIGPGPNAPVRLLNSGQEVMSGTVTMKDKSGNTADVTFDGIANTVTVELNSNPAKIFSYREITDLFISRCRGQ